MTGFYSFGISKRYPDKKPFPLMKEFGLLLPPGGFLEALSAEGDRDIIHFATGPTPGVLDVFKTSTVEVENDDLTIEEVDFYELWDAGGDEISKQLWTMLDADVFVPHPDLEPVTFRDARVVSLWDALETFRLLRSDPTFAEQNGEIGAIMRDFARAVEMHVIITIEPLDS